MVIGYGWFMFIRNCRDTVKQREIGVNGLQFNKIYTQDKAKRYNEGIFEAFRNSS
jgi:hypothetical protein